MNSSEIREKLRTEEREIVLHERSELKGCRVDQVRGKDGIKHNICPLK